MKKIETFEESFQRMLFYILLWSFSIQNRHQYDIRHMAEVAGSRAPQEGPLRGWLNKPSPDLVAATCLVECLLCSIITGVSKYVLSPCHYLMLHQNGPLQSGYLYCVNTRILYLLKSAATDFRLHCRSNPKSGDVLLRSPLTHNLSKIVSLKLNTKQCIEVPTNECFLADKSIETSCRSCSA